MPQLASCQRCAGACCNNRRENAAQPAQFQQNFLLASSHCVLLRDLIPTRLQGGEVFLGTGLQRAQHLIEILPNAGQCALACCTTGSVIALQVAYRGCTLRCTAANVASRGKHKSVSGLRHICLHRLLGGQSEWIQP